MIGLPTVSQYFLYSESTDMRKSFAGLCGLVNNELKRDLTKGDGFVFINKRRTLIKVLVWDRTGFVIYYKKLVRGTFELPEQEEGSNHSSLTLSTLLLMLEGIELKSIQFRKRYDRSTKRLRA